MDRVTKESQVGELKEKLARTASVVLADYRGLDVPTVTDLRNQFRKVQCEYRVYKNTLVKLAIKGTPMEGMSKHLEGPTAIIFSYESPAASAKVATKVAKDLEKFVLKGGYFEGSVLDTKGVEGLATMPGKDELRAKLLATFMAPATDLVRTINAGAQNFLYLLAAKERAGGEANK
jgi:large subunit ribosomal protein L10